MSAMTTRRCRFGSPSMARRPLNRPGGVKAVISRPLALARGQPSGRREDEDEHEDAEDEDLLPALLEVERVEADQDSEDDAADGRSEQVADSAEDGGREGEQAVRRPVEPPRRAVVEGHHDARAAGEGAGEEGREGGRP